MKSKGRAKINLRPLSHVISLFLYSIKITCGFAFETGFKKIGKKEKRRKGTSRDEHTFSMILSVITKQQAILNTGCDGANRDSHPVANHFTIALCYSCMSYLHILSSLQLLLCIWVIWVWSCKHKNPAVKT